MDFQFCQGQSHHNDDKNMNRQEHLQWCKDRAMQYVRAGDLQQGFTSMCSDVTKHNETAITHKSTNELGMRLLMAGQLETAEAMTKWIQGYN